LKKQFIAAGVLQGIITLIELAPFVLLVELARQMFIGAPAETLWAIILWFIILLGVGALLSAALTLWLHAVDANYSATLRHRLLDKLARLPLGWFTRKGSGAV